MRLLKNRSLLAQIGLFLLGFAASLYVSLTPANSMMNWYSIDDAFYYYKVAQNVTSGLGFTFDSINLSNGFHPLWMVICLGVFWLTRFNLLLPLRVLILVSGILNGLTGVLLFRLARRYLHPSAAVLGACVWMLLPAIFNITAVHGMEAVLSAFTLVLFLSRAVSLLVQFKEQSTLKPLQLIWLGVLGALAILSRLDNLFVVAVVGFFVIARVLRIPHLVLFDLVGFILAAVASWLIRFGASGANLNAYSIYPLLIVGLLFKPIVLYFVGFYSPTIKDSLTRFILRLGISAAVIFLFEYGILWAMVNTGFEILMSRLVIALDVFLSLGFVALIRTFLLKRDEEVHPKPWNQFKRWLRTDLRGLLLRGVFFAIPLLLIIGAYMLVNKLMFGTFTPISGQIKAWWGTLANTVYVHDTTIVEMLGLSPAASYGPWSLMTSIVANSLVALRNLFGPDSQKLPTQFFLMAMFIIFALLVYLLSRKKGYLARKSFTLLIPALTIGCFLQITYYNARSYAHTRSWYWVAEMLTLILLGTVLSSRLFEKIRQGTGKELINRILLGVLVAGLIFLNARFIFKLAPQKVVAGQEAEYLAAIRKLENHTNEGTLIGMTGGGNVAYFIEHRTIVNLDGLINSRDYFEALKQGRGFEFLDELKLDYVYGKPYMLLETEPYNTVFPGRVEEIGFIRGPDSFTLYRYIAQH